MPHYHPAIIEQKWQNYWQTNQTFRCPDPGEAEFTVTGKLYVLDMFPYPSGAGLYVGSIANKQF
ncbi:MAG: hypothetical protein R3B84_17785 [Zavarzinella sp.]